MDRERAEVMGDRRPASTTGEGRSSDEIRRDMESTRADLHETVEALERKLSPGQLLDEVWGRMKSGDGGVGGAVRDHPVPLALMGLGVAWLAVEQMSGSSGRRGDVGPGTTRPAEGRVGPYGGDAARDPDDGSSLKDRASDAASSAKSTLSSAQDRVAGKAKDVADSAKAKASDAKDRASDRAESLRSSADDAGRAAGEASRGAMEEGRHRARQAKRGFREALDDHPLAMGAVAFGLGLAGGLSAPSTRLEDRAMGDAAESVKGEAKRAARDAAGSAKRVAGDAARAAKDEADRQDVVGDLKDSAERVASEARRAAKSRAEEEDLDAEGLKERGRESADRAKDQVTG